MKALLFILNTIVLQISLNNKLYLLGKILLIPPNIASFFDKIKW